MTRTLQSWLDRADELGAQGRFFDAHEELESAWKSAGGGEKLLLQGLIQIAAALHRLTLDATNRDGASYLLERGMHKLRASSALLTPQSLSELESELVRIGSAPEAPSHLRFGLRVAA